MKIFDQQIAEQLLQKLISDNNDPRFYLYKASDDYYQIQHTVFFEREIEQLIYTNLISNPFIGGE